MATAKVRAEVLRKLLRAGAKARVERLIDRHDGEQRLAGVAQVLGEALPTLRLAGPVRYRRSTTIRGPAALLLAR